MSRSTKGATLLFSIIFVTLQFNLHAQQPNIDWGDVTKEEVLMQTYPKDTTASAVVLFDYGETEVTRDMEIVHERHIRIKILGEEGYDYATVTIPYYDKRGREEIRKVSGHTFVYNEKKDKVKRHKLGKRDVFEEDLTEDWKQVKFTLPAIEPGAVIEYKYEMRSETPTDFPNWYFQWEIPVQWSEYKTRVPEWFTYLQYFRGYHDFFISETENYTDHAPVYYQSNTYGSQRRRLAGHISYRGTVNRWVMKDLPGLKEEPYMTTLQDYKAQIRFQLSSIQFPDQPSHAVLSSWGTLAKELRKADGFGRELKSSKHTRRKVEELTNSSMTPLEKIKTLYSYVASSIEWNREMGIFADQSLKDVLNTNKGSSVEINLLLVQLLREAGINADPVLLSTRGHGLIIDIYPLVEQFNDVVVHVNLDNKSLILDATDPDRPYNLLPPSCLNGKGFMVGERYHKWIPLKSDAESEMNVSVVMKIENGGSITGKIMGKSEGYLALEIRENLKEETDREYMEDEVISANALHIDSLNFIGLEEVARPLKLYADFSYSDSDSSNDIIYVNPLMAYGITENPFKLEKRNFPVDFAYTFTKIYRASITLPEGYDVEQLPDPKVIRLKKNGGSFKHVYQKQGPMISFLSEIKIDKKRFYPGEYHYLKLFFDEIVNSHGQPLVIKKIVTHESTD